MTYEELKAAYEAAVQKCSELENEIDELKKSNEDKDLHIEHLEEQILKRNKMLFGQKSEKSKFLCDGQMDLDGNVFNEAEEFSNLSAAEPTEDSITKKSKKTGKHRGRNELRGDLETKEIVHTLPEDQRMYTPACENHLHGVSEPVYRCLRATLPDMRATSIICMTE